MANRPSPPHAPLDTPLNLLDTEVAPATGAELVGTYRETMARALGAQRGLGPVELRRGRIVLLDPAALAALAGA